MDLFGPGMSGRLAFPDLAPWPLRACGGVRVPRPGRARRNESDAPAGIWRARLSETHLATARLGRSRAPSTGFFKDRPSVDIAAGVHSHRPGGLLRPGAATHRTRSAFVVSHHLDGFLHRRRRGLVASHCRPWGSPGCRLRVPACPPVLQELFPDAMPSRALPFRQPSSRRREALPPCRCPRGVRGPASRPCSVTRVGTGETTVAGRASAPGSPGLPHLEHRGTGPAATPRPEGHRVTTPPRPGSASPKGA